MHIRSRPTRSNVYFVSTRGGDSRILASSWQKVLTNNKTCVCEHYRETSGGIRDWRKRIAQGDSATTYLFGRHDSQELITGRWNLTADVSATVNGKTVYLPVTEQGSGAPYFGFTRVPQAIVPLGSKAGQIAAEKFLKQVRERNTQFQGLVFLGELKESLRMLRRPAKALFDSARSDYLDALLRVKRRRGKDWTKAIAGTYLEWVFGVQPLISDLRSAADAIDYLMHFDDTRHVIVATGEHQVSTSSRFSPGSAWFLSFSGHTVTFNKEKVKLRGLYQDLKEGPQALSDMGQFQRRLGFELGALVPAAWELLPWSFLWDYFVNIGDVLEGYFTDTTRVRWVVKTTIRETLIYDLIAVDQATTLARVKGFGTGKVQNFSVGDVPSVLTTSRKEVTRVESTPPRVELAVTLPGISQKWLNMGALLAQADLLYPQRRKI